MSLNEYDEVHEKYSSNVVGKYQTDGFTCTCSLYKRRFLCAHMIFFRAEKRMPMFDLDMFNSIHKSSSEAEGDQPLHGGVEGDAGHADGGGEAEQVSPCTEFLLNEQKKLNKGLKKPEKFNMALDVLTPTADLMSQYEKSRFLKYLEIYKNLLGLLREGFPDHLLDFSRDPTRYSLTSTEDVSPNGHISSAQQLEALCTFIPASYSDYYDIPMEHRYQMNFDTSLMVVSTKYNVTKL